MSRLLAGSTQSRLAPSQIETLLIHLVRIESLLVEAINSADVDLFTGPGEQVYDAIWKSLYYYYREQNQMPPKLALQAQTTAPARIGQFHLGGAAQDFRQSSYFDPTLFVVKLDEFIEVAYAVPDKDLSIGYGQVLLRRLLHERTVSDLLFEVVDQAGRNDVIADMPSVISQLTERDMKVRSIGASSSYGMFDDLGAGEHFSPRNPTGIHYIDEATSPAPKDQDTGTASSALTGGWLPSETYMILGAQGGGKTQTAIMLGCEAADRYSNGIPTDPPGTRRDAFYFHYEMPPDQIRKRAMAYACRIPTYRLIGRDFFDNLSDGSNPASIQPYEAAWIQEDIRMGIAPRGEKQRFQEAASRMASWRSFCMKGSQGGIHAGTGGIPEVRNKIEQECAKRGTKPSVVIIDYALLCVRRKILFNNGDLSKELRLNLAAFADDCSQQIASRFDCAVFVMHQLKGQANSRPPSHVPTHSEAAECSAMGENFDFCFCYGTKDQSSGCMWFNASKTRDSEGLRGPCIVKLEGSFSRIRRASEYAFVGGRFVLSSEVETVANVGQIPQGDHFRMFSL